jgi:mono/diheme cytochrome c family protein
MKRSAATGSLWHSIVIVAMLAIIASFQNCSSGLKSNNTGMASSTSTGGGGGMTPPGGGGGVAPSPASGLTVQAISSGQVNLTWTDGSNDGGFQIQRANSNGGPFTPATGPGAFEIIATITTSGVTSYSDMTVMPSTLYYYQIVATNGSDVAAASPYAQVTTPAAPLTAPAMPSGLTANATAATLIALSWTDSSSDVADYVIQRSTDGKTFTTVADQSPTLTTYTDFNLSPQTTYYYRVNAENSAGSSSYTVAVSATTEAAVNTDTFSYVYTNIIGPNCASCHNAQSPQSGYSFSSYGGIAAAVSAGNATGSTLYQAMNGGNMPPGSPLSQTQLSQVAAWINAGAANN